MSVQTWQETLVAQSAAGTAYGSFTTAKSVIPPPALVTLPAGFWTPSKAIRLTVLGGLSNIATTPGLVVFQVMVGASIAYTSGPIQLNATAHTLLPFRLTVWLTGRTAGSGTAANVLGMGEVAGVMFTATAGQTDGVNSQTILAAPATAPAVGAGFDSTVANVLDFWAGFTISNAANAIQVQTYLVESLN